jgi:hypothetical protein
MVAHAALYWLRAVYTFKAVYWFKTVYRLKAINALKAARFSLFRLLFICFVRQIKWAFLPTGAEIQRAYDDKQK